MADQFVKDGAAALMHCVMIGSNEGDKVMIAAATPKLLKRAVADLTGSTPKDSETMHIAVCDAELAGLMQMGGAQHG